mmetsp:Transcript_28401/g.59959  ORF Transcript_28401/g.59959 Transcript_28401/m.59959 type:complete len:278 (-) Transcript_28401:443-1276(-)
MSGKIQNDQPGSAQERINNLTDGMDERMRNVVRRLEKVGINCDLSTKENFDKAKDIIGDLFALQQHFLKEDKKTSTFQYFKAGGQMRTSYAVSVIPHASELAYDRYHRNTPYIKEFIEVMNIGSGKKDNGAKRVAQYIARNYPDAYRKARKENDIEIPMMDEIESAAMFRDAGLVDAQARTILKHLRYKFKSKIACPFNNILSLLDESTEPGTKIGQCKKGELAMLKRKGFDSHEGIQKQIKLVHAATARGKYKKTKTSPTSKKATTNESGTSDTDT